MYMAAGKDPTRNNTLSKFTLSIITQSKFTFRKITRSKFTLSKNTFSIITSSNDVICVGGVIHPNVAHYFLLKKCIG